VSAVDHVPEQTEFYTKSYSQATWVRLVSWLDIKKHRFQIALEMDIELPMLRASCSGSCHKGCPPVYWHQGEHWIPSIGGVVREINSREQLFEQAAGKDSNLDMRRLVNIAGSRDTSWFNGLKVTTTFFTSRQASKARAFGIGADILVATVIAALGVGLPELDHGVGYG